MNIVFTFGSTHKVIVGERALLDNRIQVETIPLPSGIGAGCGLCLRVARADLETAQALLAQANAAPQSAHLETGKDGAASYTPLG